MAVPDDVGKSNRQIQENGNTRFPQIRKPIILKFIFVVIDWDALCTCHACMGHLCIKRRAMKRYYYESIVAKVLLCLSDCSTIAIGPFVFSEIPETVVPQTVRNHETVHVVQWGEVTMIAGFIILCIQTLFGLSIWWILLASIIYYIWYILAKVYSSSHDSGLTNRITSS